MKKLVIDSLSDTSANSAFLGSTQLFPLLGGLQADLYRCFMEATWRHSRNGGIVVLLHPESHLTDEKAGKLRAATHLRLRRHWQFINALLLFEIKDNKRYGVHVYGDRRETPNFLFASNLYHPDTVLRSLLHDGSGPEPGLRDDSDAWDLRPHKRRILQVDLDVLTSWHSILNEDQAVPVLETRTVYPVNQSISSVLEKLSTTDRISQARLAYSTGWHEKSDRTAGRFDTEWGHPTAWTEVILQGPHLFVSTPFYKAPNSSMTHNQDWSEIDLEAVVEDYIPATAYKPRGDRSIYDRQYTQWEDGQTSARSMYRVAWRNMADNAGQRTLMPALIPPGAAHVHGVTSAASLDQDMATVVVAAVLSSLVADFAVRVAPKSTISASTVGRLPVAWDDGVGELLLRSLRLNCLTAAYGDLWTRLHPHVSAGDQWTGGLEWPGRASLSGRSAKWNADVPLRRAADRRQAQVEIDALVALLLGITSNELCTIYRTQFGVLAKFDRLNYFYDSNGRLVPTAVLQAFKRKRLTHEDTSGLSEEERTHTNASGNTYVYELPFVTLDREADMRAAYAHFERVLAERGGA